jgi:hypothetical protein
MAAGAGWGLGSSTVGGVEKVPAKKESLGVEQGFSWEAGFPN